MFLSQQNTVLSHKKVSLSPKYEVLHQQNVVLPHQTMFFIKNIPIKHAFIPLKRVLIPIKHIFILLWFYLNKVCF